MIRIKQDIRGLFFNVIIFLNNSVGCHYLISDYLVLSTTNYMSSCHLLENDFDTDLTLKLTILKMDVPKGQLISK